MTRQLIQYLILVVYITAPGAISAQHNYVYNGGNGQGFAATMTESPDHNAIFGDQTSGNDDGFDQELWSDNGNGFINGGRDDGTDARAIAVRTNNSTFSGGVDDGMASALIADMTNGEIYHGRFNDGFSAMQYSSMSHHAVFAGGNDDGFDASLISGLVWTGAISKDWNMAGNWSPQIVPTLGHVATIPKAVPRYPVITGKLLVGKAGMHTYTCSSLRILSGGLLTGSKGADIENHTSVFLAGDLILNFN